MTILILAAGAGLVLVVARDVWHTLFHPGGRGQLSRLIGRGVWWTFDRLTRRYPTVRPLAGPAAFLSIIANWLVLVATGWALVYLPFLPEGFRLASGLQPGRQASFVDALYLSLVTLSTLGYGDITPRVGWLASWHRSRRWLALRWQPPQSRGCSQSTRSWDGETASRTS